MLNSSEMRKLSDGNVVMIQGLIPHSQLLLTSFMNCFSYNNVKIMVMRTVGQTDATLCGHKRTLN